LKQDTSRLRVITIILRQRNRKLILNIITSFFETNCSLLPKFRAISSRENFCTEKIMKMLSKILVASFFWLFVQRLNDLKYCSS
jgi:hypothetical protein